MFMIAQRGPRPLRMLALGLLVAIAPPALGQDEALPDAEEVLARGVEATGGEAAYKALKTRKVTGRVEFGDAGLRGEMTLMQEAPDLMMTRLELDDVGTFIRGTDGSIAFETNPISGERVLEGAEKAAFMREAAFYSDVDWQEYYSKAETKGVEDVDGTSCYVLEMTPKEGKPLTRFYAVDSGLLIKTSRILESPMGDVPVESFISDYREVDGLKIPFVSRDVLAGQAITTTIEQVEHGVTFPEGTFDVPDSVK